MRCLLTNGIAISVFLTLLGCRSVSTPPSIVALPVESAPGIPLRHASYAETTEIAVDFDDQRPDAERRYYPGSNIPERWHDAISFVPMEAFVPSIEDKRRQRVAHVIKVNRPQAQKASVILTSFQFALDDRENIRGEFDAKCANWVSARFRKTIVITNNNGSEEQQIVDIQRHAPLTYEESFKRQAAALVESSLEEFSDSL